MDLSPHVLRGDNHKGRDRFRRRFMQRSMALVMPRAHSRVRDGLPAYSRRVAVMLCLFDGPSTPGVEGTVLGQARIDS